MRYHTITSSLCLQAARKNGPNTWDGRTGTSRTLGLTDAPERGVWRITPAGRDWLHEHPSTTHSGCSPRQRRKSAASARDSKATKSSGAVAVPSGFTLEKLERVSGRSCPPMEFKRDWGAEVRSIARRRSDQDNYARIRRLSSGADSPLSFNASRTSSRGAETETQSPRLSATGSSSATPWSYIEKVLPFGATSTRMKSTP